MENLTTSLKSMATELGPKAREEEAAMVMIVEVKGRDFLWEQSQPLATRICIYIHKAQRLLLIQLRKIPPTFALSVTVSVHTCATQNCFCF